MEVSHTDLFGGTTRTALSGLTTDASWTAGPSAWYYITNPLRPPCLRADLHCYCLKVEPGPQRPRKHVKCCKCDDVTLKRKRRRA